MIGKSVHAATSGGLFSECAAGLFRRSAWAALVTALVSAPTLWVGFVGDDLLQRLMLKHRLPGFGDGFWRSYEFTPQSLPTPEQVTRGLLPWFTDPELQIRFFR